MMDLRDWIKGGRGGEEERGVNEWAKRRMDRV